MPLRSSFAPWETRKIDLGFVGCVRRLPPPLCNGRASPDTRTVVVLPARHPLAGKRHVKLGDLETLFFCGHVEKTHPGFRNWLNETCQQAGFTPRVLQDADLEPALMTLVAEAWA